MLPEEDYHMETQPKIGKITIAPEVLENIVRLTTLAVPGVARLGTPTGVQRIIRQNGISIEVTGNSVSVKIHVIIEPNKNMINIGHQIQEEVTRAIEDMVGMEVKAVDVFIEDVVYTG
jgi:uncharacterized alkaline shock family protein YloU